MRRSSNLRLACNVDTRCRLICPIPSHRAICSTRNKRRIALLSSLLLSSLSLSSLATLTPTGAWRWPCYMTAKGRFSLGMGSDSGQGRTSPLRPAPSRREGRSTASRRIGGTERQHRVTVSAGHFFLGLPAKQRPSADRLLIEADPDAAAFYRRMGARDCGLASSGSIHGRTPPRLVKELRLIPRACMSPFGPSRRFSAVGPISDLGP